MYNDFYERQQACRLTVLCTNHWTVAAKDQSTAMACSHKMRSIIWPQIWRKLITKNTSKSDSYNCSSDHMSDARVCLHWLRVPERVEYKIAVLTYKVLCGMATRYLGPLNRVADVSGRCSLRSSGTNRLVVPPFRLSTVGSRAFPVGAAKIWNALPDSLVSMTSVQTFRCHLKAFLFQRSFR